MSLEYEIASLMADKDLASELWSAIHSHFDGQGLPAVAVVAQKLWHYHITSDLDMAMQIQEIKNMASWLKTLGYPLSEEYQAIALLTALPDEWDNICDTILNQSRSFTLQGTVNTLLEHETILKDKQQNALLTCHGHKSKPGTSNPKSKGTGHPMCTNCNHQGHMIERCWDVGGGAEGQGPKGTCVMIRVISHRTENLILRK